MSSHGHLYPVYASQEYPGGGVQYIPFDDSRIRHFSSALGGNSLTDADKIRHIRNELPSVTVSEPVPNDSAFLPPPVGASIAAKLADGANQTSSSDLDNDNNRWHSDLHKQTVDNFPATDQNCNRYPIDHRPPSSNSSAFHAPLKRTSRQGSGSDQVFAETITQVKKITPYSGSESIRSSKRRVSETIFCLVSVPVHTPTNVRKDSSADQNNNRTVPSLTCADTFAVGLKESLNVRSKSVNEIPIQPHYFHIQTSSTSSMRNYKRAPLRKEIIDAWALQASDEKELRYTGSWPGNQYRNQETQTGSPLTVVKSTEPQSPLKGQDSVQSGVSDVSAEDGSLGTGASPHYGYPMGGQKNLHLSSNSAFSRLNLSPTELQYHRFLQGDHHQSPTSVPSPKDQQANSPSKSSSTPPESAEQEVFGQFLLKPVNRRPCDLIGELESINKEMEATITKRPDIRFLNRLSKKAENAKSEARFAARPDPGRESISLPSLHTEKHLHIKVRSKSLASVDAKGAFAKRRDKEGLRGQRVADALHLPLACAQNEPHRLYKQDIPVPQESLLKDVGLTVYTETPVGGLGEPSQPSLSAPVPPPADLLELSLSEVAEDDGNSGVHHRSEAAAQSDAELVAEAPSSRVRPPGGSVNLKICRSFSEGSELPRGGLSDDAGLTRDVFGKGDEKMSKSASYTRKSSVADRALENRLSLEKTNSLPAEDLSSYYEVQHAKGIPENESIEQRAARILGIAVPAEALGVVRKQAEGSSGNETQQVVEDHDLRGADGDKVRVGEKRPKHSSSSSNDGEREGGDAKVPSAVVLDLPEFPPCKLPLSLPVTAAKEKRAPSAEKKARGGAHKRMEPPRDECNSHSSADSPTRCHKWKVSESGSSDVDGEQSEVPGSIAENGMVFQAGEDDKRGGEKEGSEPGNVPEMRVTLGDPEGEVSTAHHEANHEEQRGEEGKDPRVEIALGNEEMLKEVDVAGKADEAKGEVGLEVTEEKSTAEQAGTRQNATGVSPAEATQGADGGKLLKAKQRTKLQKPPLPPKPRSVLKREPALPFSTGTCGPAKVEEDKMHTVSGGYFKKKKKKKMT